MLRGYSWRCHSLIGQVLCQNVRSVPGRCPALAHTSHDWTQCLAAGYVWLLAKCTVSISFLKCSLCFTPSQAKVNQPCHFLSATKMPINDVHGGDLVILHSVWDKRRSRWDIFGNAKWRQKHANTIQTIQRPFKDQYTIQYIRKYKNI